MSFVEFMAYTNRKQLDLGTNFQTGKTSHVAHCDCSQGKVRKIQLVYADTYVINHGSPQQTINDAVHTQIQQGISPVSNTGSCPGQPALHNDLACR